MPHRCVRAVARARARERVGNRRACRVVGAENVLVAGVSVADYAVNLAAHGVLSIEQHERKACIRRACGGGEPRRARADDNDIDRLVGEFSDVFSGREPAPAMGVDSRQFTRAEKRRTINDSEMC